MIKPINIYEQKQSTPLHKQGARAKLEFMAKVCPPNTIQALQHLFREMDLQATDEETGEILEPTDLEIIFNQSNKKNK
jgi:hypothetical protein